MKAQPLSDLLTTYNSLSFVHKGVKYVIRFKFITQRPNPSYIPAYCSISNYDNTDVIYNIGVINIADYTNIEIINIFKKLLK